jgi:translocation and assembly module TamB
MNFSGTLDTAVSTLSVAVQGKTADLTDITLPYLHELTGSGEFSGTLTGKFSDPVISGKIRLSSASYEEYLFGDVAGEATYRKNLLEIHEMSASSVAQTGSTGAMKGNIRFPEAKELFDLKRPLYGLSVTMKNGDVEKAMRVIYKKPLKLHPKGRFDTVLSVTGAGPQPLIKGTARSAKLDVDGVSLDTASVSFSYDYRTLAVEDGIVKRGDSSVSGKASISHDDRFSLIVPSGKVYLRDLPFKGVPQEAYVVFKAEGKGTLDDPRVEMDGMVYGGRFKDTDLGGGTIKASVKDKTLALALNVLDGRTTLTGKANLQGDFPWTAHLDLKPGRYDFIVAALLKDIPEDFLVNVRGYADMAGDRRHFSADAVINQLNVALYGNNFSNDSDIVFEVKERTITLSTVRMRSGTTAFKVSGDVEIGKGYNLVVEGSSALALLKGFSKRIDVVRGEAGFVFSLTGKWDKPRINGGVTVSNVLFGVKDIPYRISALNGYLYMDEDRIVVQRLSGKVAGGDVDISGSALLQGFALKKFYLNAAMRDIGVNISKEFTANFSGNILYTGTTDSQTVSGDIKINRALYKEPVQWQIALLKAKTRERPRGEMGILERTQLNVRLHGTENILVNNNIARASLGADLILRGTGANPLVFGRVDTKGGIVYFRNSEFRILSATADFADPKKINPSMNIIAETTIEGYTVRLLLEGTMDHFNLTLSSTPSLEQIEILSLLTVGTLSKEPKGIQGGIGGSAATSFLSGQVQNIAQERLRSITGIDRIGVESSVSRVTGKSEQRLTVSKRLLGDRVSVTYSTGLGSVATDVIRIEYNVGNNVSLVGERDEVGALGGNIKFRFGFK